MGKKPKMTKIRYQKLFSCLLAGKRDLKRGINHTIEESNVLLEKLKSYVESESNMDHQDSSLCQLVSTFINNRLKRKNKNFRRKIFFVDKDLEDIIEDEHECRSIKEIRTKYFEKYPNANFSNQTLKRYMLNRLDKSYKQCYLRHYKSKEPANPFMMYHYIERYVKLLEQNQVIIFIDESSINEHKITKKAWSSRNERNIRFNYGRLNSISVIGAIDKTGLLSYSINSESNTSEDFISFIDNTQKILEKDSFYSNMLYKKMVTIILDNSKLHTSKITRNFLKKSKFNVIYQPSYCPFVNGIEMVWSLLKRKISRKISNERKKIVEAELEVLKRTKFEWVYLKIIKELITFLEKLKNKTTEENNLNN